MVLLFQPLPFAVASRASLLSTTEKGRYVCFQFLVRDGILKSQNAENVRLAVQF
jgi:hypothetical protein